MRRRTFIRDGGTALGGLFLSAPCLQDTPRRSLGGLASVPPRAARTTRGARATLSDVNATSLTDAIAAGCHPIANAFDPADHDSTYFVAFARPRPSFGFFGIFAENVAGVKLNALLAAQSALGSRIADDAFPKLRRAVFTSLSGPVMLPLHREKRGGPPVGFAAFNIHAALGALTALIVHRGDERAHDAAERVVAAILELWNPEKGWDSARLKEKYGLELEENVGAPGLPRRVPLFPGIGGAIGALAIYHEATRSPRAKELITVLRDMIVAEYFPGNGEYDPARMGSNSPMVIRMMYVMSQTAAMQRDTALMEQVRRFYSNGRKQISNEFGWSPEAAESYNFDTEGAMVAGFVAEVALTLARAGDPSCYQHVEQILRARLLPSQLRDVSWIPVVNDTEGGDEVREVGPRLRGSWGNPAPYGLKAKNDKVYGDRIPYFQDIPGFVTTSLCTLLEGCTEYSGGQHRVNLLFDRSTGAIEVRSPYTGDGLRLRTKRPGAVLVRMPPWVERAQVQVNGGRADSHFENGYPRIVPALTPSRTMKGYPRDAFGSAPISASVTPGA